MKAQGTKLPCNCIICTWQPVRVVYGDGHIRSLTRPVTVRELLQQHPHHFVCEPTSNGPVNHVGMLPLDMKLEEGRMYLLLPLPKLLPHLASTFPNPASCPCFSHRDNMPGSSSVLPSWESCQCGGFKDYELVCGEPGPVNPGCSQENEKDSSRDIPGDIQVEAIVNVPENPGRIWTIIFPRGPLMENQCNSAAQGTDVDQDWSAFQKSICSLQH